MLILTSSPRAIGALAVALCTLGACDRPAPSSERPPGFWFDVREPPSPSDLGELGYAAGHAPPEEVWTGIRVLDEHRAFTGPLVIASGHEPAAYVLHGDGELERRWALDAAAQDAALLPTFVHTTQRAWRRVEPLADGGLLAIHDGLCLLRLDARSKIVWSAVPGAHHDLLLDGDSVWVLDRRVEGRVRPDDAASEWLVDDGIARVALEDGRILERVSLLEALAASAHAELVEQAVAQARSIDVGPVEHDGSFRRALDPLHSNAIVRADGSLVVLLRDVGALAGLDPETLAVESLRIGPWQGAHDPQVDPDDPQRVLLFDNFGRRDPERPASRVLALDLAGGGGATTVFEDDPPERFYSPVCGSLSALPGGSWLVVESTAGRAFQIDAGGELVWEFRSPFRIEEEGLVAALLDVRPLR
ncbi:MAG: arylsulfotransferase family protein [Planctomycetota bacterium]